VDYSIEGTELIDFVSNGFRPRDGRKVSGDGHFSAARRQDSVTAPTGVSTVQDNTMSLLDQQLGSE
jgi:hypothetical protein